MANQNHILLISSWYPNRNNVTHGIFNRSFAEAAAIDNKVSVLHVCSDANLKKDYEFIETEEDGLYTLIIYYKKIISTLPILSQLRKKQKLIKLFDLGYQKISSRFGKPNLMQLNVVMPSGIGVLHLYKKYKIPYIVNENWTGYMPEDGNYKGFFMKYFTKKIISSASIIMPVSKSYADTMQAHGLKGNYVIVPNIVDVNLFKPLNTKKNEQLTRFIHISTFDQDQKNVEGIINAFEKALSINNQLELTFVGHGDNKKAIEKFVEQKKLNSQIKFKGLLLNSDLVEEINANDALLMFSNYESFCLVIAEAFACGVPVITSKCGGITDNIPEFAGINVTAKNEQELTKAIINFTTHKNKYEATKIRQIAVNNYSKQAIGKQLTIIYNSVLNNTIL